MPEYCGYLSYCSLPGIALAIAAYRQLVPAEPSYLAHEVPGESSGARTSWARRRKWLRRRQRDQAGRTSGERGGRGSATSRKRRTSLALMAGVSWQLGRAALVDPLALALGASLILARWQANLARLVLGSRLAGLARSLL